MEEVALHNLKIIFDEIKKLKKDMDKDIISIIEDVGASGGYYIAMAADEVFASETSIVGSIGVRLDSYDVRSFLTNLVLNLEQFILEIISLF